MTVVAMAYVEGPTIHDADSHVLEPPDCLDGFVEARWREKVRGVNLYGRRKPHHNGRGFAPAS